jgi:hypothetical protein
MPRDIRVKYCVANLCNGSGGSSQTVMANTNSVPAEGLSAIETEDEAVNYA